MCEIKYTNGESLKVTKGHPLFTQNGWKAIDTEEAAKEDPGVPVTTMNVGDFMKKDTGSWDQITNISCKNETIQTYNFTVDNTHTYFAGGFLAHNKGGGGGLTCSNFVSSVANPNVVASGGQTTVSCDFGAPGYPCIGASLGSSNCAYTGASGSTDYFNCTAPVPQGGYNAFCRLFNNPTYCPSQGYSGRSPYPGTKTVSVTVPGGYSTIYILTRRCDAPSGRIKKADAPEEDAPAFCALRITNYALPVNQPRSSMALTTREMATM